MHDNFKNTGRRSFLKHAALSATGLCLAPEAMALAADANPERVNRKPRILLRSNWQTINIGDIGHTPGTIRIIQEHLPEAEVTLWPLAMNQEVEQMLVRRFPDLRFVHGAIRNDGTPVGQEILQAFEETDLFLFNSGMHFNHGHFSHDWNRIMGLLTTFYISKDKKKPYGMYGHSFDKFAPPSEFIFRDILNGAAFIYCRETESLAYLREHRVEAPVMAFGPDGCFGIDVLDEPRAEAYLKAAGLKEKKFLAVVIRTNTPKLGAKGGGDQLNPYNPTPEQAEQDRVRMGKVREIITAWVRQTRLKVLLAPEVDKEMIAARTQVYDQLPPDVQRQVVVRDTFWNADEALSVYKRAHTVVGVEPHSLIMALAVGVPVIHACPFGYGKKGWMFRDIGLPEWLFDIDQDPAADMAKALLEIHHNYKGALAKVDKAMRFVREKQQETMQAVRKVLT